MKLTKEQLQEKILYGHVFLIDDFIEAVKTHCIIDYDGSGYLCDGEHLSDDNNYVRCDVNWLNKIDKKKYPYVVWFNK